MLLSQDGTRLTVDAVTRARQLTTVYNFTVDGDHNYYATSLDLLVHNDCPGLGSLSPDDLTGSQAANYRRFTKRLPAGAEEPTLTRLPDGTIEISANVPGRVPGSYATYTKVIDASGNTITFYKTTVAPDGTVVHVKIKYP